MPQNEERCPTESKSFRGKRLLSVGHLFIFRRSLYVAALEFLTWKYLSSSGVSSNPTLEENSFTFLGLGFTNNSDNGALLCACKRAYCKARLTTLYKSYLTRSLAWNYNINMSLRYTTSMCGIIEKSRKSILSMHFYPKRCESSKKKKCLYIGFGILQTSSIISLDFFDTKLWGSVNSLRYHL